MIRAFLIAWLALSTAAAPPLFRAQNQTAAPGTNVLDGFTHYWLADDIAGVDGDPVGTWPDGIASNNATAAGSARPTLRTGDINGKNAVQFDAVNDGFDLTTLIDVSSGFTVCTVSYRSSQPNNWFTLTEKDSPFAPYGAFWFSDGTVYLNDNATTFNVANASTGWRVVVGRTSSPYVTVDGASAGLSPIGSLAGSGYFDSLGKRTSEFTVGKHSFVGVRIGPPDPAFIAAWADWVSSYYGLP